MKLFELLPEVILFGSIVYFWVFASIITIILLASEKYESWFWVVASILGFISVTHFLTDLDVESVLNGWNLLGYFVIGFLYAILRTFIWGRKTTPSKSEIPMSFYDIKSKVIAWWTLWPVSIINWVLSDLISDVCSFIYDRFDKLFEYVFKLGLGKIKEEEVDTEAINDRNNDR